MELAVAAAGSAYSGGDDDGLAQTEMGWIHSWDSDLLAVLSVDNRFEEVTMFRRAIRKALWKAREDNEISEDDFHAAMKVYRLPAGKQDGFWVEVEGKAEKLLMAESNWLREKRLPRTATGRIDWSRLGKWLQDHIETIIQIMLALLPLFI